MANASITVTFVTDTGTSGDANESIDVELDEVYNNNATTFNYGTKAYFRVYKSPSSMTLTLTQSDGTITSEGSGTATKSEQVTFANTNTASVSFPINAITSTDWLGTSLGAVSGSGSTLTSSRTGVGVLDVEYTANFTRYAIMCPTRDGYDEYAVLVYITGTTS